MSGVTVFALSLVGSGPQGLLKAEVCPRRFPLISFLATVSVGPSQGERLGRLKFESPRQP